MVRGEMGWDDGEPTRTETSAAELVDTSMILHHNDRHRVDPLTVPRESLTLHALPACYAISHCSRRRDLP